MNKLIRVSKEKIGYLKSFLRGIRGIDNILLLSNRQYQKLKRKHQICLFLLAMLLSLFRIQKYWIKIHKVMFKLGSENIPVLEEEEN